MASFADLAWIFRFDYTPTLIFAVIVIYYFGFLFGSLAGIDILVKKRPSLLFGIIYGFLIVWSTTFVGSLVGFFTEGLANKTPISEPFNDYIIKPLLIITFYGFIPIIAIGIWYGYSIKKHSKHKNGG